MKPMLYYRIAPVAGERSVDDGLTYHSSSQLPAGSLVKIPLGKQQTVGVILRQTTKPEFATKPVKSLIEDRPLPEHLTETALWMSRYYTAPLSSVFQTMLPRGLEKLRRISGITPESIPINRTKIVLNDEQSAAVRTIMANPAGTVVLRGVTGSGKTQVYIEVMKQILAAGHSGIILVPEISLTTQLRTQLLAALPGVVVTHSSMTEAQRHLIWRQILYSEKPLVVIGPRSALFSPLHNLGLVVIDECHEPGYKQENQPRYLALRAARVITKAIEGRLILGSATPSITDSYLAQATRQPVVLMTKPATRDAVPAKVRIVDLKQRDQFRRHRFLSDDLIQSIENSLAEGRQSLIFHNRRGSAPLTICQDCGWTALCQSCHVLMTLHVDRHTLICHICGRRTKVPSGCPVCRQPQIVHRGIGTKLVADELSKLFPRAKIARFDADTKVMEQLHNNYREVYEGKIDILIGTQVIAKGLDLPHLGFVGVIQADSGLGIPDYQSRERVFQLVYQVCGRVGRLARRSDVVIQTYQPNHPSIVYGSKQDYDSFYKLELAERRRANFPPYCYLAKLTCSYSRERQAVAAARAAADELKKRFGVSLSILGPAPAFYERLGGRYRWQLILKSARRSLLTEACLNFANNSRWIVDPDPAHLL